MLFGRKQIGAYEGIALFRLGVGVRGFTYRRCGRCTAESRHASVLYFIHRFEVSCFYPADIGKKARKPRILRVRGVLAVFFDTELLLTRKILEKLCFLLCKLHFLLSLFFFPDACASDARASKHIISTGRVIIQPETT